MITTDSQCSAPGAGRPACAVAGAAGVLRIQIRNDEALVDHMAPWVAELAIAGEEQRAEAMAVAARLQIVGLRLRAREAELARLLSPAVTVSHEESLAGSLVTPNAALPGKPHPAFDPARPF